MYDKLLKPRQSFRITLYSWYSFLLEAESTPGPWCDGRIMSMKNPSDTIWNRTSDLPICSTAVKIIWEPEISASSPIFSFYFCWVLYPSKLQTRFHMVFCYIILGPGIEWRWGRDFPHPSRPAWPMFTNHPNKYFTVFEGWHACIGGWVVRTVQDLHKCVLNRKVRRIGAKILISLGCGLWGGWLLPRPLRAKHVKGEDGIIN